MILLERVRDVGLRRHLAKVTIECYQMWIEQFLRFCRREGRWRQPGEIHAPDVEAFLPHLARDRRLSASSQNQAMCAIVFLYKQVLVDELGEDHLGRIAYERSRRPVRVPTVQRGVAARPRVAAGRNMSPKCHVSRYLNQPQVMPELPAA